MWLTTPAEVSSRTEGVFPFILKLCKIEIKDYTKRKTLIQMSVQWGVCANELKIGCGKNVHVFINNE